jgi:hypothetical protein
MRQYITMFDFEKQRIGLVESDKERIRRSETKNLVVIAVLALAIVLGAARLGVGAIRNRMQKDGKLII